MSGKQSDLSKSQYGYDMVLAVTQESLNATLKQFLDKYEGKEFVQAYVYKEDVPKGSDNNILTDFNKLKQSLGFDPFTVKNDTPSSDERIKALMDQKFTFAFKTEIGLPDFENVPDTIVMNKEGSYVTYNMVCKVFEIIVLEPSLYGQAKWINLKQSDPEYSEPWTFSFTLDLDLRQDSLKNHFHLLPPEKQEEIKSLGESMFSIQQLFLDLNSAALSESHKIKGLDKTSTAYVKLTSVFFGEYFSHISQNGGVMLGYSVKADKKFSDDTIMVPTDLNFEISSYKEKGKASDKYRLYTLNYIAMADEHHMPVPSQFSWNWIDSSERKDYHGTCAIKKGFFVGFLNEKFSQKLNHLCMEPHCKVEVNLVKGSVQAYLTSVFGNKKYNIVNNATDGHILSFSYSANDSSSAVFVPNWADISIKYSANSDIYLQNNSIKITTTACSHVHINVEGGVTEGDFAKYKVENTYKLSVDAGGNIVVTETGSSTPKDISEDPDPNWWSRLVSLGTVDNVVNGLKSTMKDSVKNFIAYYTSDIKNMLNNGSHTWVFPGGKSFIFKDLYFSDNLDLVTHVVYVDPEEKQAINKLAQADEIETN